jgi:hypothetical protein
MSNTEIDLDTLTLPGSTREIFDPVTKGAWPDVSSRIYISTHRSGPEGVIQIGYDPDLDKSFVRSRSGGEESRWGDWVAIVAPPPEPPATRKAKAKADEEPEATSKKK